MSHNHVGIPRFIQNGFAYKNKVFVSDIVRNKIYQTSIDRLGTENNYYDEDVEKVLASDIEANFSSFYNNFCNTDPSSMKQILDSNVKLVERFLSFMYIRAKKTLSQINDESITAKAFGEISHSELLNIQSSININPLTICKDYSFYPLINYSKKFFINNSIGFGMMAINENKYSFIIPLNIHVSILISGNMPHSYIDYYTIQPDRDNQVDAINKCIVRMEKILGNGFFFGRDEETIKEYTEFFKTIKV